VEVFSAEGKAIKYAIKLRRQGYQVRIYKKHQLSQREVMDLLRRSRVFIGVSRSDGLPASFLEAMSQGAFPIQSNTSVAGDWIKSGVTGSLVDYSDVDQISAALEAALSNDDLVLRAAESNLETVKSRASNSKLRLILQSEFGKFAGIENSDG
jgi:glycosyltransferase involved in cell wall biosynthesis